MNILILCTGNSCRSQMAHGYLTKFLPSNFQIFSAGIETHGVNPKAIFIMKEDGVDISLHTSNNMEEYKNIQFEYVITVCDHANEVCPIFNGNTIKIHHNFPDPAKASGTEAEIIDSFRSTRDLIKEYIQEFANSLLGIENKI